MGRVSESRYTVQAGWDSVPHLDERAKRELLNSIPPYLREARSRGIPSIGAGAIYPIPVEEITCAPFQIPPFWRRGYGHDVGWRRTAALWGAEDPTDGVIYLNAEYYQGQALPVVHATAIKARGEWIRGASDPASRQRSQADGSQLMATYQNLGLHLVPAVNAVDDGLVEVWNRLVTGRLKVFTTLQNFLAEYRLYRRVEKKDEDGVTRVKIVKENDHLMDCMRYLVMTWAGIARVRPADPGRSTYAGPADRTAGY